MDPQSLGSGIKLQINTTG